MSKQQENPQQPDRRILELAQKYEANQSIYLDMYQYIELSRYYSDLNDFYTALDVLTKGLEYYPDDIELLAELAIVQYNLEDYEEALYISEEVLEQEPLNPDMLVLKTNIMIRNGNGRAALTFITEKERFEQLNIDEYLDILEMFMDESYSKETESFIKSGEKNFRDNESYLLHKAEFHIKRNQAEKARSIYNSLIDKDSFNPLYWLAMAQCSAQEKDYERALEECDLALAIDDKYEQAYLEKGNSYYILKNFPMALDCYQKGKSLSETPFMYYTLMGYIYMETKEYINADKCFSASAEELKKVAPHVPEMIATMYCERMLCQIYLGNYEEVHRLCKESRNIIDDYAYTYFTEGKCYLYEKKYQQAEDSFHKATLLLNDEEMNVLIAKEYLRFELIDEAEARLRTNETKFPRSGRIIELLEVVALYRKDVATFLRYYKRHAPAMTPEAEEALRQQLEKADLASMARQLFDKIKGEDYFHVNLTFERNEKKPLF